MFNRNLIIEGVFHIKNNKPTSFDIAYLAGVSQPTVSRALRNSPLVSKCTRQKIQRIAREINYKVDINARNLRSQESKTIALLFCEDPGTGSSLINPFFLSMLGSITSASAKRGYDLLISFQQYSDDWAADYENTHRADGIIFLGYGDFLSYSKRIEMLVEADTKFITWGPASDGQTGHYLGCDNKSSAYHAVKHLIKLGRKNIAFLGEVDKKSPEFEARFYGYHLALSEAGLCVDNNLQIDANLSEDGGYDAACDLLKHAVEVDAIFAASDVIAFGVLRALKEKGLSVPEDIAVVGFDDLPTAAYTNPPLTTVEQDTELAGELLVDNLTKLIAGETITTELLPAKLVVRESCGVLL